MRVALLVLLAAFVTLCATVAFATSVPSADVVTTTFTTSGTGTGSSTYVPPRGSVTNLRVRILTMSTDGLAWGTEFDNITVKNVGGVVSYYLPVALVLGNLFGQGAGDSGLTTSSAAISTGTDAFIVTGTGTTGKTQTWSINFTARVLQP